MDIAFLSHFEDGEEVFDAVEGDVESFRPLSPGTRLPCDESYCSLLNVDDSPSVVNDARADERVKSLKVTHEAGIGSYVGVPIHFSDGRLYGVFCCLSQAPDPRLVERHMQLLRILARFIGDQLEREELQRESHRREIAELLFTTLEARDGYTAGHCELVVRLATEVGRKLELSDGELADLAQVALLHDIGKIGIPDDILRKEGPLTDHEWALMRQHPMIGERLIKQVAGLAHIAPAIRAEHERWDGSGYPDGLAGDGIPVAARIVLVCDAYHAMMSDRPYRAAMSDEEAKDELVRNAGSQFWPGAVSAFQSVSDKAVTAHRG